MSKEWPNDGKGIWCHLHPFAEPIKVKSPLHWIRLDNDKNTQQTKHPNKLFAVIRQKYSQWCRLSTAFRSNRHCYWHAGTIVNVVNYDWNEQIGEVANHSIVKTMLWYLIFQLVYLLLSVMNFYFCWICDFSTYWSFIQMFRKSAPCRA